MPAHASSPELLTLHAVRLLGFADEGKVAARFRLDHDEAGELLKDFEAYGWVYRAEFDGSGGWTLTETGRAENERQLAAELAASGASDEVKQVHAAFLPLNGRFQETAARWQVRPGPGDPMALNDHTDFRWDDRVIDALGAVGHRLASVTGDLSAVLARFDGYSER